MKVRYYGNACFSVFHNGIHILCDPWLDAPSVAGGWTHFPPCNTKAKDIPRPDYIFVSHIHTDHCEAETLSNLDKSIPIIGLARNPDYLSRMLRSAGFNDLRLVPERTPTEVGPGLKIETFGATFDHVCAQVIDSSILFDFGDAIALNCNDNAPEEEFCRYIAAHYPKIDLAFVPAGGGGAYPAMYSNLTDADKARVTADILEHYAGVFTKALDIMKPAVVVPVAGAYAICGELATKVNRWQPRRLNNMEVVQYYAKHGHTDAKLFPMNDGMIVDVDNRCVAQGEYKQWTDAELDAHFARLAAKPMKQSVYTTQTLPTLGHLIETARARLWTRQQDRKITPDYTVILDVPTEGPLYAIDLSKPELVRLGRNDALPARYLRMTLSQDTMLEWLLGFEDYNMLDSGHRIEFYRHPNDYVQEAYLLMSSLRL